MYDRASYSYKPQPFRAAMPNEPGPQQLPAGPPPHWGEDPLSEFVQIATTCGWASFVQQQTRPWFDRLRDTDAVYLAAIDALHGPTPNFFEGLMLVSAHAAFRGAAQFALEGRTCEAMVLLRSCLEYALYGVHLHRKPDLVAVWSVRGNGDKERKAVKKAFKVVDMMDGVTALNNAIGDRLKHLYELTIDMGAHPNELGFYGRLEISDVPGTQDKKFSIKYLDGGGQAHLTTLKNACQVGVCVLECFWLIYRQRFDILQIKHQIDDLKPGL